MTKETRKSFSKYIIAGIYSALAVALYWFWAFPYRAALSYREQMQLFQTTGSYLADLAGRPAGISVYIGEFLTQTFNNFWIGAAVMTGCFILFLHFIASVVKSLSTGISRSLALLLSILPLISLWLFYGEPDVTLNFMIAILMAAGGAYAFIASADPDSAIGIYLHMIAAKAFLYWLAGPATIIFTLLTAAYICRKRDISVFRKIVFSLVSIAWIAANVVIWSAALPYPLSYQLIGIGFIIKPDVLMAGQVIVVVLSVIVPALSPLIARVPRKIAVPSITGVAVAAVIVGYPYFYNTVTYRLIDYDYMVRINDWDGILSYSDRHDPDLPLSVSATNLASGMTGQLDSRAFDYYQNGTEGLLPPFVKETLSSWTTGEIFFQLGMINSAQRFYFEGMEAIPNYNKSVRAVRRMAETAMIRGDYPLAEKYLRMLRNTTFYSKWAQRNLELIRDPRAIDSHPLYGKLRKRMIDEDYLFSEGELDKTLGQLFIKDPGNDLARQYLILYPLLQRNLDKFGQYMGVVVEKIPQYNPLLAQQALAFISMKNVQPIPQNMVSPVVEQSLRGFAQAWTSKNPDLIAQHRHTLFYYLISNE